MARRRRSPRGRRQQKQQQQQRLIIGAVALVAVLVAAVFFVANKQTVDAAYYKHVTPSELERIVQGNEPVLVYFHSPT